MRLAGLWNLTDHHLPPHTRDMISLWPPPAAVAVVLTAFLAMNLCAPTVTVTITVMPVQLQVVSYSVLWNSLTRHSRQACPSA
jgi:hypothetical protein